MDFYLFKHMMQKSNIKTILNIDSGKVINDPHYIHRKLHPKISVHGDDVTVNLRYGLG